MLATTSFLSLSLSLSLSFTYSYFNPVSLTHAHTTTRALALSLIESEFTPFIFYREQIHLSFIRTRSFGASSIKSDLIFVWKLQLKSKQDKRQLLFNFFSLHLQRGTNLLGSCSQCCFIVISMRWQLTNENENKSSSTKHLGYRILRHTCHRKGLVISVGPVIASRTCLGWQLIHVAIETESEEVHTYLIMCSYLH